MGDFMRLRVYQGSVLLADDLRQAVMKWPSFDRWTVGVQMVRAADSIGANLAEAYGRRMPRDQQRFLFIARGSAHETEHWISRALERGLLNEPGLMDRARGVGRMLNGLIRSYVVT